MRRVSLVLLLVAGFVSAILFLTVWDSSTDTGDMSVPFNENKGAAGGDVHRGNSGAGIPLFAATASAVAPAPIANSSFRMTPKFGFSDSSDLWLLAQRAAASGDMAQVIEGYIAASECISLNETAHLLQLRIQAAVRFRAEMDVALSALLERCKGFVAADAGLRQSVERRLRQQAEPMLAATNRDDGTARQAGALALLRLGSPAATQRALLALAPRVSAHADPALVGSDPERAGDLVTAAALAAACDVAADCTPGAYRVLLQCAMMGLCEGPIQLERDADWSDAEWQAVQRLRADFVRAARQRDLSGLPGGPVGPKP